MVGREAKLWQNWRARAPGHHFPKQRCPVTCLLGIDVTELVIEDCDSGCFS